MKIILNFPLVRLALVAAWILFLAATRAQDFDALILRARQQAEAGQFLDSLATAQQAIKDSPQNFKGYYYAAYSLYQTGDLDDAERFVKQAQSKASEQNTGTVGKLVQAIRYKRVALAEIKTADAAVSEGLLGKAAQGYQRAWQSGHLDPAIGMKAAKLFVEHLGQAYTAATILREIVEKFPNSPPGATAADLLVKLKPDLTKAAEVFYRDALRETVSKKKVLLLLDSIDANPAYTPPYLRLAELGAADSDPSTFYGALKQRVFADRSG